MRSVTANMAIVTLLGLSVAACVLAVEPAIEAQLAQNQKGLVERCIYGGDFHEEKPGCEQLTEESDQ